MEGGNETAQGGLHAVDAEASLTAATPPDSRIKVAIIGGGCASMATAWELTGPEHGGRYHVTVYQEGWRLGGKGASGRGENGRIEEHGLHIWLGFYDNAFRMMRACHTELEAKGLGHLYGDFRDAWTAENDVALCSASETGGFQRWQVHMPPRAGYPGDPLAPDAVFSLQYYMAGAFDLLRALVLDTTVDGHGLITRFDAPQAAGPANPAELAARIAELARMGLFASAAMMAEVLGVFATLVRSVSPATAGLLMSAVDALAVPLRQWIEDRFLADHRLRFLWEIADLTLATLTGFLRYGIMFDPRGLDAIDDYECREWMRLNGASLRSLQSPFLRGLYDLSMGYEDGDPAKPRLSAGQGLRGTLRTFFGYRGAFMWRMRAGMGDVVFAPLYTALKERGVDFRFFHRLADIELDAAGTHAARLRFDVQAQIAGGGEYQPLIDVQGRPCWPSVPDYKQLERGDALLAEGRKFESHWDRRREGETVLDVGRAFRHESYSASAHRELPHQQRHRLARAALAGDVPRCENGGQPGLPGVAEQGSRIAGLARKQRGQPGVYHRRLRQAVRYLVRHGACCARRKLEATAGNLGLFLRRAARSGAASGRRRHDLSAGPRCRSARQCRKLSRRPRPRDLAGRL